MKKIVASLKRNFRKASLALAGFPAARPALQSISTRFRHVIRLRKVQPRVQLTITALIRMRTE
ncbi:MAG TPA: hypothetical protein VGK00_03195 [Anaerolineales bacterium]